MSQALFPTLFLHNSDGQKLQAFAPFSGKQVKMYCCGPTVYNYAHIGNLRAYTVQDILRRSLQALSYELDHVMNITDVGHLSGDGDDGEDKMVLSARTQGRNVQDIADYYTQSFFSDCAELNIARPETICRATEHIQDMQELIAKIEAAGYTYHNNGNLYFDTSKLDDYGRLVGLNQVSESGALSRTGTDAAKKNQRDFVLWFSNGKFADQAMQWDSPWGRGYPGWHIECSAMASRFLGSKIDIHCGGIDHKAVHHSNEIAQSESLLSHEQRPWVQFWLHNEFVVMNQPSEASQTATVSKISKSSGTAAITLSDLKQNGFSPLDYRYFLLGSHYRSQVHFHYQAMAGAQKSRKRLQQKVWELQKQCPEYRLFLGDPTETLRYSQETVAQLQSGHLQNPYIRSLFAALLQDLNTPQALASLWDGLKDQHLSPWQKLQTITFAESLLQFGLLQEAGPKEPIPQKYLELLAQRNEARREQDYPRADALRAKLQDAGYQIIDTAQGSQLQKQD